MTGRCFIIVLFFGFCLGNDDIRDCENVVKTLYNCLSDNLTITCPADHGIRMIKAELLEAEDVCRKVPGRRDCYRGTYIRTFADICTGKTTCEVPMSNWRNIPTRQLRCTNLDRSRAKEFFHVEYICIQKTQPLDICSPEKRTVSSVHLVSHPEGRRITSTDCRCTIKMPRPGPFIVAPIKVTRSQLPYMLCNQHIGLPNYKICTEGDRPYVDCSPEEWTSVRFANEGSQDVRTFFSLGIAAEEGYDFEIECGLDSTSYVGVGDIVFDLQATDSGFGGIPKATTTSTTTTTTTPTTTTTTTTSTTMTTTTPTTTTATTTPATTTTMTIPSTTSTTATTTTTPATTTNTIIPTTSATTATPRNTPTRHVIRQSTGPIDITFPPESTTTRKTTSTNKDDGNFIDAADTVNFYQDERPFPTTIIIAVGVTAAVVVLCALIAGTVLFAKRRNKLDGSEIDNIYDEPSDIIDKDPTMAMPASDDVAINPMYGKSQDIFAY